MRTKKMICESKSETFVMIWKSWGQGRRHLLFRQVNSIFRLKINKTETITFPSPSYTDNLMTSKEKVCTRLVAGANLKMIVDSIQCTRKHRNIQKVKILPPVWEPRRAMIREKEILAIFEQIEQKIRHPRLTVKHNSLSIGKSSLERPVSADEKMEPANTAFLKATVKFN